MYSAERAMPEHIKMSPVHTTQVVIRAITGKVGKYLYAHALEEVFTRQPLDHLECYIHQL